MNKISFRTQVFLLLFSLLLMQVAIMVWYFNSTLSESIKHQVGTRALVQAREIASDPRLIQQVENRDINALKTYTERLSKISDASFIVIGDKDGVRLAHPVPTSVGHPMQGGDNVGVLEHGKSYVTLRKGSLGYGLRGKTPILDAHNNIIGVVSVGYLLNRFDQWLDFYMTPLLIEIFIILILTLIAAWAFSRHIQKQMNGMEPAEIALALKLQESILSSVYEGVIAIDRNGYFLAMNDSANKVLGIQQDISYLRNRQILEYVSQSDFFFRQPLTRNLKDEIIHLNGHSLIANRNAIFKQERLIGWVVSFREKDEIYSLTTDLTQIKQHTDSLRVLRHEFSNRLATISGLLQMGKLDEVQKLIATESANKQQLIDFIQTNIKLAQVAGLILGKSLRAKELNLDLNLDPTCQLSKLPALLNETELCAILGNLIDNAFESSLRNPDSSRCIDILISDAGPDLVIEVTDNGVGIDPNLIDHIWRKGFSSKPDKQSHGIGLYLVNQYVVQAKGFITVNDADPKGCIFSIFIPIKAR